MVIIFDQQSVCLAGWQGVAKDMEHVKLDATAARAAQQERDEQLKRKVLNRSSMDNYYSQVYNYYLHRQMIIIYLVQMITIYGASNPMVNHRHSVSETYTAPRCLARTSAQSANENVVLQPQIGNESGKLCSIR